MANILNRIPISAAITIWGPRQSSTLINAIWTEECYTKEYSIKEGDLVIDIGANIGIFSIFAASRGAYVCAFEPNPETFRILHRNVVENDLGDRIKIFNCAVSDTDGHADLQIPDTDKIYALGSATISHNLKNDMSKKLEIRFKSVRIETVSLKTFLEKHLNDRSKIDLLKVDCEGAEIAIFEGLENSQAEDILNIAMETHEGYSEKEITALMNEKGFVIDRYVKRTGHYRTGYCYARHIKNRAPHNSVALKPVALLENDSFGYVNKPFSISAGDSFLLNGTSRPLTFLWRIDGEIIQEQRACFEHSFAVPGVHRISCTVSNGSDIDYIENKIVVLEEAYFQKTVTVNLVGEGEKIIVPVMGEATFCLSQKNLPKTWDFDKLVISIAARERNIACLSPILESNGSVFNLKAYHNEIELDSVHPDLDVIFTLTTRQPAEIEVNWWAKKNTALSSTLQAVEENDSVTLGETGSELYCVIENTKIIRIPKEAFPKDWSPHCLKFGIAAMPINGIFTQLDGYFEYRGNRNALTDWYTEIAICDVHLDSNMEVTVFFNEKRKIKIVWWAE